MVLIKEVEPNVYLSSCASWSSAMLRRRRLWFVVSPRKTTAKFTAMPPVPTACARLAVHSQRGTKPHMEPQRLRTSSLKTYGRPQKSPSHRHAAPHSPKNVNFTICSSFSAHYIPRGETQTAKDAWLCRPPLSKRKALCLPTGSPDGYGPSRTRTGNHAAPLHLRAAHVAHDQRCRPAEPESTRHGQ